MKPTVLALACVTSKRVLSIALAIGLLLSSIGAFSATAESDTLLQTQYTHSYYTLAFEANPEIGAGAASIDLSCYSIIYNNFHLTHISLSGHHAENISLQDEAVNVCIFTPSWHDLNAVEVQLPYMKWNIPGFSGFQWSSSDENIFRIESEAGNANSLLVFPSQPGTAYLRLTLNEHPITVQVQVTVTEPQAEAVPKLVQRIVPSHDHATMHSLGEQFLLNTIIWPENACNPAFSVTVSDPAVIHFEDGVVTALDYGTAVITFEAQDDSGVAATATVEVFPQLAQATAVAAQQPNLFVRLWQTLVAMFSNGFGSSNNFIRQTQLRNADNSMITQGFAVGTTFSYSFEVNANDTRHNLYRYNMSTGVLQRMTITPGRTVGPLGHANDMALVGIGGRTYMFVVAYSTIAGTNLTAPAIVKLRYDGNHYHEVARFPTGDNFTGISRIGHVRVGNSATNNAVQFLVKRGARFFTVTIRYDLANGTPVIPVERFRLNEAPHTQANGWIRQGIHYQNNMLYVPLWGGISNQRESVILTYNISSAALANNFTANPLTLMHDGNPWVFRGALNRQFEIEGAGIRTVDGVRTMWFNTFEGHSRNGGIYTATRRP